MSSRRRTCLAPWTFWPRALRRTTRDKRTSGEKRDQSFWGLAPLFCMGSKGGIVSGAAHDILVGLRLSGRLVGSSAAAAAASSGANILRPEPGYGGKNRCAVMSVGGGMGGSLLRRGGRAPVWHGQMIPDFHCENLKNLRPNCEVFVNSTKQACRGTDSPVQNGQRRPWGADLLRAAELPDHR